MVTLMTIPQTEHVLSLWKEELRNQINNEALFTAYSENLAEVIGHANVYLIEDNESIRAYAIVVEGYYIAALYYSNKDEGKELLEHIKGKYDELQIDVPKDSPLNETLKNNGFIFIEESIHESLNYQENAYEFLIEEKNS